MKKDIYGFLFPVPHPFIGRLVSGEKDVFVKIGRLRFLSDGHIIVFYDSGAHKIVGEAKIKQTTAGSPSTIWAKYGPRIFLREKEYNEYVARSPLGPRHREGKIMTAFVVEHCRKYSQSKIPPKRVTPSGYYLVTAPI